MSLRITIIAVGSRGDVQPYVALGVGLERAGFSVGVLTSEDFRPLVTACGLEFHDMGGNIQSVAQGMQDLLEQGNFLKILSSMKGTAQRMVLQAAENGLAACRASDLLLSGLGGLFVGQALAEKLGVPLIQAYLYPFTPTREFPGVLIPLSPTPLTAWANRASHRLTQQMMWQATRSADNKARAQVLGIRPAPFWGPFSSLQQQATLYGYSRHVIPPPGDWDFHQHVTGYWFLEPAQDWQPPVSLVDFLQAGPPPIFIGFGSMGSKKPEQATELILQALAQTGQRGVLLSDWNGLKKEALPETVFITGSVPYSWLFPRMAAVVHHGGAGTTAAGLAAGVPSIITPFMGDQPFWAQRIYRLGVGPRPIPRRRLTVERLSEAIRIAISNVEMRQAAASLGECIRAEDGVARAVEMIQKSEWIGNIPADG
jgi:sterol 3beta-glucosyltransferase